jgi:hypothetical protein
MNLVAEIIARGTGLDEVKAMLLLAIVGVPLIALALGLVAVLLRRED